MKNPGNDRDLLLLIKGVVDHKGENVKHSGSDRIIADGRGLGVLADEADFFPYLGGTFWLLLTPPSLSIPQAAPVFDTVISPSSPALKFCSQSKDQLVRVL